VLESRWDSHLDFAKDIRAGLFMKTKINLAAAFSLLAATLGFAQPAPVMTEYGLVQGVARRKARLGQNRQISRTATETKSQ
jgi:hypothetical protein